MSENAPQTPRDPQPGTVDFGYKEVPASEKAKHVRAVFDSVADKYDLMTMCRDSLAPLETSVRVMRRRRGLTNSC